MIDLPKFNLEGIDGNTKLALNGILSYLQDADNTIKQLYGNKINISNIDTTTTLGTSDELVPSQNAVKTYADSESYTVGYKCRAWVNFNGTGTVAIRASMNVSSITDNGTGDYTINFTTAMIDVNYNPTCMVGRALSSNMDCQAAFAGTGAPTASALRMTTAFTSQVGASLYADLAFICVSIFR